MDYVKILKRAWETTWRYRALWIFGIILAITTASGSSGAGGGNNGSGNGNNFSPGAPPWQQQGPPWIQEDFPWAPEDFDWPSEGFHWEPDDFSWENGTFVWPYIPPEVVNTVITVGITVLCLVVLAIVVTTTARFVSETALIRMVNHHEETGEKRGIRQGFRMGWSPAAFRLFLIRLAIGIPLFVIVLLMFGLVAAPMLAWLTGSRIAGVIGTVTMVGLFFSLLFLLFVVGAALSLLFHFFSRVCVLQGLGVVDSIREGYSIVRRHLKDVGIMWLIMVGVRIGWAIVMVIATIVMIPIVFLLIAVGTVLGGLPALLIGWLASLFFSGPAPWIIGAVIGIPIFALVVGTPWIFLGGLMETFKSSTWTLVYRELLALEELEPEAESDVESDEEPETEEWPELDEPSSDSVPDSL